MTVVSLTLVSGQVFTVTVASRSWLFHFIASATPALWQLPSGDGIGSLHLRLQALAPLRSGSLLSSTPPITHGQSATGRGRGAEKANPRERKNVGTSDNNNGQELSYRVDTFSQTTNTFAHWRQVLPH